VRDVGIPEVREDGVGERRGSLPWNPRRGALERAGGDPRPRSRRALQDHHDPRRSPSLTWTIAGRRDGDEHSRVSGAGDGEWTGLALALARWGMKFFESWCLLRAGEILKIYNF
jgi:hypothetical protein